MGILKKITDEYFEKVLRNEDGKYLNVMGCNVIVPMYYDEEDFLDVVEEFTNTLSSYTTQNISFRTDDDINEDAIQIECGNGYMEIETDYNHFLKFYKNEFKKDMNENLFNSIIKFLRHISKDVDIVFVDGKSNIMLVNEDDFYNKFLEFFSDNEYEEKKEDCLNTLVNMFFKEFESKAHIIRNEFEFSYGDNYGEQITMRLFNYSDIFQFKTLLYAKEMKQWWDDTLNEIEMDGIETFFDLKEE